MKMCIIYITFWSIAALYYGQNQEYPDWILITAKILLVMYLFAYLFIGIAISTLRVGIKLGEGIALEAIKEQGVGCSFNWRYYASLLLVFLTLWQTSVMGFGGSLSCFWMLCTVPMIFYTYSCTRLIQTLEIPRIAKILSE